MKGYSAYKNLKITNALLYGFTFLFLTYDIFLLSAFGLITATLGVSLSFGFIGIFLAIILILIIMQAKLSGIVLQSLESKPDIADSYLSDSRTNLSVPRNTPVSNPALDDFYSDESDEMREVEVKYTPPRRGSF